MKYYEHKLKVLNLNEEEKYEYIKNVDNPAYKILLIQFLEETNNKEKIINSVNDDAAKLDVIHHFQDFQNSYLVAKSIDNDKLKIDYCFAHDDESLHPNVYELIISTVGNEDLMINLLEQRRFKRSSYDSWDLAIIKNLSDQNKEKFIFKFDSEYDQNTIIKSYKDDDKKKKWLENKAIDRNNFHIITTIKDVEYIKKILVQLTDESLKAVIARSIDDEKYQKEIYNTLESEMAKAALLLGINDEEYQKQELKTFEDEYHKQFVVRRIKDPVYKEEFIKSCVNDNIKLDVIDSFTNINQKKKLLNYITNETLRNNQMKYYLNDQERLNLIENMPDGRQKIEFIGSLDNESLIIQKLMELKKEKNQIVNEVVPPLLENITRDTLEGNRSLVEKIVQGLIDEELKYKALDLIDSKYFKTNILKTMNDYFKLHFIKSSIKENSMDNIFFIDGIAKNIQSDEALLEIRNIIKNLSGYHCLVVSRLSDKLKVLLLDDFNGEDRYSILKRIDNKFVKENLLHTLESSADKLAILDSMNTDEMKVVSLKNIKDYHKVMQEGFAMGMYKYVCKYDKAILEEVYDEKQITILEQYVNIRSDKVKDVYSKFMSENYNEIDKKMIEKIPNLLSRIELSNSSEIRAVSDKIVLQVLKDNQPYEKLAEIENVFIKNNIPYFAKSFEVFKNLHSTPDSYENFSPILNEFKKDNGEKQYRSRTLDLIIFNDLLKCSLGSNNRSLKNFIDNIEKGDKIFAKLENNENSINYLNKQEISDLSDYLDKIEIILSSYDIWKGKAKSLNKNDLLKRINYVKQRLTDNGDTYKSIPDIIVKKFAGFDNNIKSFADFKRYSTDIIAYTDKRNRDISSESFNLEKGDFIKSIFDVKHLPNILQNGSVAKEFLGDSSTKDRTPLDTDLWRVNTDLIDNSIEEAFSKLDLSYDEPYVVLRNDGNKINITKDNDDVDKIAQAGRNIEKRNKLLNLSKLEAFATKILNEMPEKVHYGIRTGFPSSDISYIVSDHHADRIALSIAMNGFYVPHVNTKGELVFTPEDYDYLRNKMAGLSYYNEGKYTISDNLVNKDIIPIVDNLDKNKIETRIKREKINAAIQSVVDEYGLIIKEEIDGDLSTGSVELIDTGSSGRGTNKFGDTDFDFMLRFDRELYYDKNKIDEIRNKLLEVFGKIQHAPDELTKMGDLRLKKATVGDYEQIDIDITFIPKTDKMEYSTDMCLKDRLQSIKEQYPDKYNYVIANIIFAKEFLKQNEAYKSKHAKETPQGGLGGVGVENWILQNGGSFIDAAKEFLKYAENKSFEEFIQSYSIWDFGSNHMALLKDDRYLHDNFIANNLSEEGYKKITSALSEYIQQLEPLIIKKNN